MQVEELRIGNYVMHKKGVWSYRVDSWPMTKECKKDEYIFQWNETDWYKIAECCMDLDYIEPIPLTEEWLLKFGFERKYNELKHDWVYNYFGICFDCDDETYFIYDLDFDNNFKNVHQLQNLYFALTGKELKIN